MGSNRGCGWSIVEPPFGVHVLGPHGTSPTTSGTKGELTLSIFALHPIGVGAISLDGVSCLDTESTSSFSPTFPCVSEGGVEPTFPLGDGYPIVDSG